MRGLLQWRTGLTRVHMEVSRSQLDKMGKRIASESPPSDEDLHMLTEFQQSLSEPYIRALHAMRIVCAQAVPDSQPSVTGRSKQFRSIVAKLRRHHTRLSSMQDLMGFRVIVPRAVHQERVVRALTADSRWELDDKRSNPMHGYRAVHAIWHDGWHSIEVQIRTELQHYWADWSENLDRSFPGVKYGEGDPEVLEYLRTISGFIQELEQLEVALVTEATPGRPLDDLHERIQHMHERLRETLQAELVRIRDIEA